MNYYRCVRIVGCFAMTIVLMLDGASAADLVMQRRISYQGKLTGNTGQQVNVTFRMINDQGETWGPEPFAVTPDSAGNFAVLLGSTGIDNCKRNGSGVLVSCAAGGDGVPDLDQISPTGLQLTVNVNGTDLSPPQKVLAAFHANSADNAGLLVGQTQDDLMRRAFAIAMPLGTILDYGSNVPPAGFLTCDGTAVPMDTYPDLFKVIGGSFGLPQSGLCAGGSNSGAQCSNASICPGGICSGGQFNLPDLRGKFTRMADLSANVDPDRNARVRLNPGGNLGGSIGSLQMSELKSHTHSVSQNPHSHQETFGANGADSCGAGIGPADGSTCGTTVANNFSLGAFADISINASAGTSETRPINVYVNKIIKAENVLP